MDESEELRLLQLMVEQLQLPIATRRLKQLVATHRAMLKGALLIRDAATRGISPELPDVGAGRRNA